MERRLRKERRLLVSVSQGLFLLNRFGQSAGGIIEFAKSYYKEGRGWGRKDEFWGHAWTEADLLVLEQRLVDEIYNSLKAKYERQMVAGLITLSEVEEEFEWHDDCLLLMPRLYELLALWYKIYGPKVVVGRELTALASDNQNVHTGPVNKQTRTNLGYIAATEVPKGQKTLDEILTCWLMNSRCKPTLDKVYKDMLYWANKNTIVSEGDWLYRLTLRGLWAKIKTFQPSARGELIMRLWEECSESVEMCAQGHLSRLANVLAGFDHTILMKRSLQDEMAYISRLNDTLENKIKQAVAVMDEMSIPSLEQQAWLDAF